jgi:hypothetical protein
MLIFCGYKMLKGTTAHFKSIASNTGAGSSPATIFPYFPDELFVQKEKKNVIQFPKLNMMYVVCDGKSK